MDSRRARAASGNAFVPTKFDETAGQTPKINNLTFATAAAGVNMS
jgi:hypothetical protein